MDVEKLPLNELVGRSLAVDVVSDEFVPAFDRSTVDGFAVISRDLVGCSESIPAILRKAGETVMGTMPGHLLKAGECFYVPTGGALPQGADAMVMIEFVEDFGAGDYGFTCRGTWRNMIFKGEDLRPETRFLKRQKLTAADIGTLAAMGITKLRFTNDRASRLSQPATNFAMKNYLPENPGCKYTNALSLIEEMSKAISFTIIPDTKEQLRVACVMPPWKQMSYWSLEAPRSGATMPTLIEELGEVFVHGSRSLANQRLSVRSTATCDRLAGQPGRRIFYVSPAGQRINCRFAGRKYGSCADRVDPQPGDFIQPWTRRSGARQDREWHRNTSALKIGFDLDCFAGGWLYSDPKGAGRTANSCAGSGIFTVRF